MKVLVWGLNHVGVTTAVGLTQLGHEVIAIDSNLNRVNIFNRGEIWPQEPELAEQLRNSLAKGQLKAVSVGTEYLASADISLICIHPPNTPDGSPELREIKQIIAQIGLGLKSTECYHVVGIRSGVFPGISRNILLPLLETYSGLRVGQDFGFVINPEFIRKSTAIADFHQPPYTIIGELSSRCGDIMASLYQNITAPIYRISLEEAEVMKMVNTTFHALKVGFANEIGRLCDSLAIDSHTIMDLICSDARLNTSGAYLQPGFAFGGASLLRDLRSINCYASRLGIKLPILDSILPSNQFHIDSTHTKIYALGVKRIAILGVSFKPYSGDVYQSSVIPLIEKLWQEGFELSIYDPDVELHQASLETREYLKRYLPQAEQIFKSSLEEALQDCETVVITQNRPEFRAVAANVPLSLPVISLVRLEESPELLQTLAQNSPSSPSPQIKMWNNESVLLNS
ncbi:MAG: nucleotide sugar dehydrogenase [Microcoleaceae cyanobacterium]